MLMTGNIKNHYMLVNTFSQLITKTEFMEKLEFAMKAFNDNPNRDYTKNFMKNGFNGI